MRIIKPSPARWDDLWDDLRDNFLWHGITSSGITCCEITCSGDIFPSCNPWDNLMRKVSISIIKTDQDRGGQPLHGRVVSFLIASNQ